MSGRPQIPAIKTQTIRNWRQDSPEAKRRGTHAHTTHSQQLGFMHASLATTTQDSLLFSAQSLIIVGDWSSENEKASKAKKQ